MPAAMDPYDLPEAAQNIQLVSLGCTSAAKVTFKKLGRSSEALPFDWVSSTLDGLMNFLTNDFLGFYEFGGSCEMPVPGSSKSAAVFQSSMHVVRQDDPTSQPQTGYLAAIEQFKQISARDGPVLFVRVAATSQEVQCGGLLVQTLRENYGPWACLLLIVDDQGRDACGPCTIVSEPNLLIDYTNTEKTGSPYVQSICTALKWAAHLPVRACEAKDLAHVYQMCSRDTDWGLFSSNGQPVFLKIADGAASIRNSIGFASVVKPAPKSSAELEAAPIPRVQPDPELDAIPIMSLGSSPAVKRSLRALGRGAEAFPFDWINTTMDGVIHFLLRDFANFFGYTSCVELNGVPIGFRSPLHSFWNDDISNEAVKEGYRTRVMNMKAFDAKNSAMMFVREAATGDEVRQAGRLLQTLNGIFGMWATILLIVDNQGKEPPGFIQVENERGLMIYFCDTQGAGGEAPYAEQIYQVLGWTASRPMSASMCQDLGQAYAYVKKMDKGMYVGNHRAFDNDLEGEGGDHFKFTAYIGEGEVQDSDLMDQMGRAGKSETVMQFMKDPDTEHIQLVSLGCSCAPKMSFKAMGRGAETLPFDWMRTTLQGVYTFLQTDFAGYFDFTTRMDIDLDEAPGPGGKKQAGMVMYRGQEHSFWHDDPRSEQMHEKYNRRINRFKSIDAHSQGVLFVRGAATTDEVVDAGVVARELVSRFGNYATLLMILDFQGPTAKGAVTVDNEPNLMLYFNDTKMCVQQSPHVEAVRIALEWVVGKKVLATSVPTVEDAVQFVHVVSHYGLKGTTGVPAFESVLNDPRIHEVTKEEVYAPSAGTVIDNTEADVGHGGKLPRMQFQGARKVAGRDSEPAPEPPAALERNKGIPVNVSPVKKVPPQTKQPVTPKGVAANRRGSPPPTMVVANGSIPDGLSNTLTSKDRIPVPTSYGYGSPVATSYGTPKIPVPTSYEPARGVRQNSPPPPDRGFIPERTVSDLLASAPRRGFAPQGANSGSYVPAPGMRQMGAVPQVSTLPSKQVVVPQVSSIQAQAQIGRVPQVRTLDSQANVIRVQVPQVTTREAQAQMQPLAQLGRAPQVSTQEALLQLGRAPQVSTQEALLQLGRAPQVSTQEARLQMGRVPQVSTAEGRAMIGTAPQINSILSQSQMSRVPQIVTDGQRSWTPIPTGSVASMGVVPAHLMGKVPQVSTIPRDMPQDGFEQPGRPTSAIDLSRRSIPLTAQNIASVFGSQGLVVDPYQQAWAASSPSNMRVPQVSTQPRAFEANGQFARSHSMRSGMQPGMQATIAGVDDSNQSLKVNGKICTLVSFDAGKNKWIIRLPEGSTARVPTAALTLLD